MRLLIDGYNLLYATDLFGRGKLAGTLQGSREALLARLAELLSAGERRATVIVFDAAGAPPGLPKLMHFDHMTVRYAREYADADTLLEEIIELHRAPRGLTVVSSDHRVQRAARRRGATYLDSEPWFRDLSARRTSSQTKSGKPTPEGSVDYWVQEFAADEIEQLEAELRASGRLPPRSKEQDEPNRNAAPEQDSLEDFDNPFPPGYGEDLLEE